VAILRGPESECRKEHQLKTYGLSSPEWSFVLVPIVTFLIPMGVSEYHTTVAERLELQITKDAKNAQIPFLEVQPKYRNS
jgi:hypothetical protein